ncbi:MAG TPA: tetratricopeptide repeat protein [Caulobacteraceae bacterium]
MNVSVPPARPAPRLQRLMGYLEADPGNLNLIEDAVGAAFEEGDLVSAGALLGRYAQIAPLPDRLRNLEGLIALRDGRTGEAGAIFEGLLADNAADPALRFNLAWCKAVEGDNEAALTLLDDGAVLASPRAAVLKVHTLHRLGRLEDALAVGQALDERGAAGGELLGALSAVAMDLEDAPLAKTYAQRAGGNDEAQAALGMFALGEDRPEEARAFFRNALAGRQDNARALLGDGLALMAMGHAGEARPRIEQAAELFGDHLGSWIAAGWADLVCGDAKASRAKFEKALAIDDTFAESHGALAVIDLVEGNIESAQRRTEIAQRLDRNCFSAALARSMLFSAAGDERSAERVRNIAMNVPVGLGGRTLAQALSAMGATARPRS